jgi:hypothetical protein
MNRVRVRNATYIILAMVALAVLVLDILIILNWDYT